MKLGQLNKIIDMTNINKKKLKDLKSLKIRKRAEFVKGFVSIYKDYDLF